MHLELKELQQIPGMPHWNEGNLQLFFEVALFWPQIGCPCTWLQNTKHLEGQSPLHMILLHTASERLKICCVCKKTARCGTERGKVLTHLPLASRSTCIQRILPMEVFKIKGAGLCPAHLHQLMALKYMESSKCNCFSSNK